MSEKSKTEVRVRGVSPKLIEELNTISKNLGVSLTEYLRGKFREISNNEPEKLKRKIID